jgi:hypothetical protein
MRRGLLATRQELRNLRTRIARKPFDGIYEWLRKRCSLILEIPPVTESHWQASRQQGAWATTLEAARTTQGRIVDLLIAHHVEPNGAYRDRAIEELKNLISWSTWNDPCHGGHADLCTAEAAVGAALALDWLWEDLSEADRLRVLHAIRAKGVAPYRQAVIQGAWWHNCYHNWNAVVNGGMGLVGLALGDDEPSAQEAYHMARAGLRHFFDALGREGGWDEGTGYWGYAMRYLLLLGEAAARVADDMSLFHARGMDATSLFPIYFSPNGVSASFGDSATVPMHGTLYLFAKHFSAKELIWWLDTYSFRGDVNADGWSRAGAALLFRPEDAETVASPDLCPVKAFNEIGWAAMADRWPRPSFYVSAKTGDLSANHSQRDMNSIQVQVDGEMLLVDLGHPPYSREYFSEARGQFYEVQARGHNTIILAGRDHPLDAQGSIIEAQAGYEYRWIACDAGNACGENARFHRHLVLLTQESDSVGKTLVVLDEIHNAVPEKAEMFWHSFGEISLDEKTHSGKISGQKAELNFAVVSTAHVTMAKTSRELGHRRQDNALCVTCPPAGKTILVSVFSRDKIGKIELKAAAGGEVKLKIGSTPLHFKVSKRRLALEMDEE